MDQDRPMRQIIKFSLLAVIFLFLAIYVLSDGLSWVDSQREKAAKALVDQDLVFEKQGNLKEAISLYSKAIELNSKDITAYLNRASSLQ